MLSVGMPLMNLQNYIAGQPVGHEETPNLHDRSDPPSSRKKPK